MLFSKSKNQFPKPNCRAPQAPIDYFLHGVSDEGEEIGLALIPEYEVHCLKMQCLGWMDRY